MRQLPDNEAELLRAEATIVVLRGLAAEGAHLVDRYQVPPHVEIVGREEARVLLARLPKPRVCVSAVEPSALRIECRSIEDFFSIPPELLKDWGAVRGLIEFEVRQRLEKLSLVAVEDWMVTIASGDAHAKLDLANFLKWMSEYAFRGCDVTEEYHLDVKSEPPNMVFKIEAAQGDRPDIVFRTPP